jgi:asparagine synthase (glutamine-hydrolysing)
MPGFFCAINLTLHKEMILSEQYNNCIQLKDDDVHAALFQDSHKKFIEDKVFQSDGAYVVILEGIVFNKLELMRKTGATDWKSTLIQLYQEQGDSFCKILRGSFSGLIYDKKQNKWVIYNDHIGDKPLFCFRNNNFFVISSEVKYILDFLRSNRLSFNLDEQGAYMLLSFGYQLEDFTLVKEIKKLRPGHHVIIEHNNKIATKQYYYLKNDTDNSLSNERDLIEQIDIGFRAAVKKQFDKDIEYGYRHLVGLSGGLDSRMTTWVAHDMGYTNMLNFTFSQSDYWDEKTAKAIAIELKHEWLFKSLDNGLFLKSQLDDVTDISYGSALYYGLAHGKSCLDLINMDSFGLVHSGQLGDVVISSFFKNVTELDAKDNLKKGAYSTMLIDRIGPLLREIEAGYPNNEVLRFYTRGFSGANQGLLIAQQKTETFSPFYDVEFMEFCLSIPQQYRMNHQIYIKWIQQRYPSAADFHWEKAGTHLNAPTIKIKGKRVYVHTAQQKLKRKLFQKLGINLMNKEATKHHMNPLDYWYNTNADLKIWLDTYFKENVDQLAAYPQLRNDVDRMYKTGNNIEKNQVITLLAACKLLFQ